MQERLESYIQSTYPEEQIRKKSAKFAALLNARPSPLAPACRWPLAPELLVITALSLPLIS
jgi:hypothetical protein